MRIKSYLLSFLAGTIFFASCQKNAVTLSYTNAKGEVPQLGNLVFRFNQALATDSMLNAWDSSDYVSFDPAIKGRFRWESPDELVFSPAEPLQPATEYKAKLKNAVLKYSKYNAVRKSDKISFHTAPLTLEESRVTWVGESSTSAYPQLDLYFNYIVDPEDLKSKLDLESEGKEIEFTAITASPQNKHSFRLGGIKTEDRDIPVSVSINKGLNPAKGGSSTGEEMSQSAVIPSPFVLGIQDVQAEHDGVEGVVRVVTNQQLTGENIRSFMKLDPAVNFTVQPDEFGFTIRSGDFDTEKAYALTISKGLRGRIGGVLKEEYNEGVGFGELESNIRFTSSKAVYLSKKGSGNVEVQLTNVPKVKLVISRIYENNLLFAQQYGYEPREKRSGPDYASYEGEYSDEDYSYGGSDLVLGDVIYEKEIDTRSLPKSGVGRLLNLNQFEDRLPDFNGVYHVVIRSSEDYWVRDSRFISLSDLGLIAREGSDKIYVFANSIKTAEAINGVNVTVYATNNQLIGTGSTNKDGVAEISYIKKDMSGFKPALLIARTADDFNYLPFAGTRVNTSRFEVGGKRNNPSGLDAFVYAERDLYRPGEKISYSVLVRNGKWDAPGDMMLKLKFILPNGKELRSFRKSLNDEGAMEGAVDISTAAITGVYTLEVYTSNDVLLASKYFSVEEFVPDRLKVSAKLDREDAKPADKISLTVNATNFFGPVAADRKVETEIQVRQLAFSPEGYEDYNFSLTNQNSFFDKEVRESVTDAAGNAVIEYEVPGVYSNMGALQTNFYSTVFDETGRPVSRSTNLKIYTQPVFFGVKEDWFYYYPLNQSVRFPIVALNKEAKKVSAQARVEVIKHEYKTVLTKSGSYFRYESQQEDKMMAEATLAVGNNTTFAYVPRSPGDYEVRFYIPGASSYVSRRFYSYGNRGSNDNNAFEVNNEGNIDIDIDRKSYLAGESVKALFKTPFSGRMLVTMETDHVISYQYVDVNNRAASLDLKLTEEHLPNVYITATLVKPHEVSDIPLTVAHGFKNLLVEAKDRKIEVQVSAQKAVRSKTKQKVLVKAAPNSYVSFAAVDNGVLQVNDYKTPDPYSHFYEKKALQVSSYDLYPLLFAEVRARMSSTGGDDRDEDMKDRVNPLAAKRIKVVSYWGGLKKTNSSGVAEFEFDVPQFSGELRLMAVSFKGNKFGAGEETMTVADPVVISTALPRFLSPGDTVNVPVTLTNTTSKNEAVTASITVAGPMKVVGNNQQKLQLGAKQEARAMFRIIADPSVDVGKITVTVNGMGEKFTDATDISVRPASTLQRRTMAGSVNGGGSQRIQIATSDFMPASVKYSLVVSRSPAVQFSEQLKFLVQYPYGCTEQVISSAFPQLYYGDLADLMHLNREQNKQNANTNILEAIRKIKLRQLYNGAVTLWDGEGEANWWTTVYATHFLLEARKAGFEVDNSLVETMIGYLNSRLKSRETVNYYYNRDQNKKIAPKEVAYSLYVLALAGRTNVPAMNYYKANQSLLALDSRYLLAAAYATAGDKKAFNALLPGQFSGEVSVPQTGGSFYSDVRDEAIALNALLDTDPGNAQIGTMVKHVADKLKSRIYLSTQERSFSFLALGKHARRANASNVTAEVKAGGKAIAKVDGGEWRADQAVLGGNSVEIVTRGTGQLYYFWEASGISATGAYREEDSYLKARRQFYDRNGKPLATLNFKQNDLIIIGISVEKSFDTPVENVVITDLLPAGFEIENPRTKEIPGMDWIKDGSSPVSLDVRDDRIHFFVDLYSPRQTYYYAVRAVSPGSFKMGPVSADAMYNGEYHSYHGAGIVRVQ
jgi:uncharacterized protein YfaS (alpha-2-macroglobulin family)